MKEYFLSVVAGLLAAGICVAADSSGVQERIAAIEHWRAERLASLTSESGWLTPVALYWLKAGENRLGRTKSDAFFLDDAALAPDTGAFWLDAKGVRYVAHTPNVVKHDGQPVREIVLQSDSAGPPTELIAGSLHFTLIDRMGHLGIRVKDTVSPQRTNFRGLTYFPIRTDWAVDARFVPYQPAHSIKITNILGMQENMISPGALVFSRGGREWRLDAVLEEPGATQLFIMFSDATSGTETYGAGRFLDVDSPVRGHAIADFNEAYNPPCAFTDFATCPLPPPQNRLSLRIDAGELKYTRNEASTSAP